MPLLPELNLENISQTSRPVQKSPDLSIPEADNYTNLVVSSNSLSTYQLCVTKSFFSKILHLYTVGYDQAALDRGTFVHWILAEYYKAIIKDSSIDRLGLLQRISTRAKIICTDLEFPSDVMEKVLSSFAQYVMYHTNDWVPLKVEQPFLVHLGTNEELKLRMYFEGKMDLVAKSTEGIVIIDHKSLDMDRDREGKNHFWSTPTNQTKGYALAGGVSNVIINKFGLQTSLKPHEKFQRVIVSHTPEQLEEWRLETIRDCVSMYLHFSRVTETSLDKDETILQSFPKNNNHCVFCSYKFICNSSPTVRPWKARGFYTQHTEDFDVFEDTVQA